MMDLSSINDDILVDGKSFYPQLKGSKGDPREWIYFYFDPASPRLKRPITEFVRERKWKLYSDNRLFNVIDDPDEKKEVPFDENEETLSVHKKLRQILDNIKN